MSVVRWIAVVLPLFIGISSLHAATETLRRLSLIEDQLSALKQEQLVAERAVHLGVLRELVLRDAAGMSALNGGAIHDGGFRVYGNDNLFSLQLSGYVQTLFVANQRSGDVSDRQRMGFETRRLRVRFAGHANSERLKYRVSLSLGRDDDPATLSDGFIEYQFKDAPLHIRIGQFRPSFLREEAISAKRQGLVERSLLQRAWGVDRNPGLDAHWQDDTRSVAVGLQSVDGITPDAWLATARLQWLAIGDWSGARDNVAFNGEQTALLIGIGAAYLSDESLMPGGDDLTGWRWTADVSGTSNSWNWMIVVVGQRNERGHGPSQHGLGISASAGTFVTDEIQINTRLTWGDADDGSDELLVLTTGVNWYVEGHDNKLMTDIGYAFNGVGDAWASSGAGWLEDAGDESGQLVFRSMLQLVF